MARLVCNISLRPTSLPPLCFLTLIEELQDFEKASNGVRISGQTVPRIGMKMAVSWGRHHVVFVPKRNRSFQNANFDSVYHSLQRTISGYWEGPDMEDGWGYVEAVVDRGH